MCIRDRPCGVTETGVEGFTDKDYWSKQILTPATGRKVSMIVMLSLIHISPAVRTVLL